jgi:Ca2+-binding RTX toxin-like protein
MQIDQRGELIDGAAGDGNVSADLGQAGLMVSTVNRWSVLGQELGLTGADAPAYVVTERGATADFGTGAVEATYWSLQQNLDGPNGQILSATALESALAFGGIALNALSLTGSDDNDLMYGSQTDDYFIGGAGNDYITTGAGADRVEGGAGEDVLLAGTGNDDLYGGAGKDTFVFMSGDGFDTIHDLDAQDVLDLRGLGVTSVKEVRHMATVTEDGYLIEFGAGDGLLLAGHNQQVLQDLVLLS